MLKVLDDCFYFFSCELVMLTDCTCNVKIKELFITYPDSTPPVFNSRLQWLHCQVWLDPFCDCELDLALGLCCINESPVFGSTITFLTVGDIGSRVQI